MTRTDIHTAGGQARVAPIAGLFLRLGATAFGGPAAHVAMMHREVVDRLRWMDDQRFVDLYGATNLIPGPNSTELAMYVGQDRAGWRGLITAGAAFILPAAAIVLALAWMYIRYGQTPAGEALLYGIKPVVIAIIVQALLRLGRTTLTSWLIAAVAVTAAALYLTGVRELLLLTVGALAVWMVRVPFGVPPEAALTVVGGLPRSWLSPVLAIQAAPGSLVELSRLFGIFLKIGAVLYGSGYVLLAFLRTDLVQRLGWLTETQLLDAIAIGQFTPGPVLTTATFVGYVVGGPMGAILATIGIFLPSFLFVGALSRILPYLHGRTWARAVLDGVNAAALGLMAGVSAQLGRAALIDPLTVALALATGVLLWRTTLNSAWLIAGGALTGVLAVLTGVQG